MTNQSERGEGSGNERQEISEPGPQGLTRMEPRPQESGPGGMVRLAQHSRQGGERSFEGPACSRRSLLRRARVHSNRLSPRQERKRGGQMKGTQTRWHQQISSFWSYHTSLRSLCQTNAAGGIRTPTGFLPLASETSASTSSATAAKKHATSGRVYQFRHPG